MVIRRVYSIVATGYLALILVVPSRLTRTMATIILVVFRARKIVFSAVADHACLSTSMCVIVAKLAKVRFQAVTRSNEKMPTMLEEMVVFVAVESKLSGFRRSSARGERWPLDRGG